MNRSRSYGEGDVRINNTINLNEDIYNIGFISLIRDDIMRKYLDVETGLIEKIQEEGDSDSGSDSEPQNIIAEKKDTFTIQDENSEAEIDS